MEFGLIIIWIVVFLLWALYKLAYLNENFFKDRGIAYEKPVPFFGNVAPLLFNIKSIESIKTDLYKKFKREKVFGIFNLRKHDYIVSDPDYVKQITIKDMEYFMDHHNFLNANVDTVLEKILIFLRGSQWKNMRTQLSPIFTSSKMKLMFHILADDCKDFTDYFKEQYEKNGRIIIDAKDTFSRLTMNGISHSVFGLQSNCLRDENEETYKIGRKIIDPNATLNLKLVFGNLFPTLYKFLGMRLLTEKSVEFGRQITVEAMKYRERNNIVRADVLQLLMEANKGQLKYEESQEETANFSANQEYVLEGSNAKDIKWTDDHIIAEGLMFFFAG